MLGSGTIDDPYQITNRVELESIANDFLSAYKLMNDIDLSDSEWTPLPPKDVSGNNFIGTLDGNGKKIMNMKIRIPVGSITRAGLFETLSNNSVVKKLGLENVDIISNYHYVGGLAGSAWSSLAVEECYVTGRIEIIGNFRYGGGLIGNVSGTTFSNCYTNVDFITGTSDRYGSFCGSISASFSEPVKNCLSFGTITSRNSWNMTGGFYGYCNPNASPEFTNCFFDTTKAGTTQYANGYGLRGLSTENIKKPSYYLNYPDSIWNIVNGEYPSLLAFAGKSLIESRSVISHISNVISDKVLNKKVTYKRGSYINNLSVQVQKEIKLVKTGTSFIRDIVSDINRSIQVVKVGKEAVTSYILPITSNIEVMKRQVNLMTSTVTSHIQAISSGVEREIKSLRESFSFIDAIVGKAVTPNLKLEQINAIVNHLENGTLSQYLSNQYNTNVLENLTFVEVMD